MANETVIVEGVDKGVDLVSDFFHNIYSRILVAVIILFAGFIIGKLAGKLVKKVLHELEVDSVLKKLARTEVSLENMLMHGTTYLIYFIAIIMALNHLGVTTAVLQMISGAAIVLLVIAILLGVKDFIPNAFAGFRIHRNKFLEEGEMISVKGMEGKVVHMDLLETEIKTSRGDSVYIPNSTLTKTEVIKLKTRKNKIK